MNKSTYIVGVVALVFFFTVAIGTIMAKTPQQPYKEIKMIGSLEIRFYPSAVMATVQSTEKTYSESSNSHFRKLAGYIFGGNQDNTKIAMTAPVHMSFETNQSSMSFVMPEGYTLEGLPKPNEKGILLHSSPEEYVAVLRFGGYASDKVIAEKKIELLKLLKAAGLSPTGDVRFLGYNAPWDFLQRRNEVIVSISKADALK
jgi:hypothetical protein